jgi:hypothetical protein
MNEKGAKSAMDAQGDVMRAAFSLEDICVIF